MVSSKHQGTIGTSFESQEEAARARIGRIISTFLASPVHFSLVEFDSTKSVLHLRVLFLGQEREISLQLFQNPSNLVEKRIYFRSLGPWLSDLQGVFLLSQLSDARQQTEIGFVAESQNANSWATRWIFSLALKLSCIMSRKH